MLSVRLFVIWTIYLCFYFTKASMFKSAFKIPVSLALYGGTAHYSKGQMSTVCAAGKVNRGRSTPISLVNKVVLITGATSGIGEACAWQFAEQGSKLILVGRREDRLNALKKDIIASFPKVEVHTVKLSVTDTDAVAALPKKLPENFRDVEILVNNAGLALGVSSVENNSIEDAKTVMDTNVIGTIALCRAFVPGMKERGAGHIINMGSVAVSTTQIFNVHCRLNLHLYSRVTFLTCLAPSTARPSTPCMPSRARRATTWWAPLCA